MAPWPKNSTFLQFLFITFCLAASVRAQSLTRTINTETEGPSTIGSSSMSTMEPVPFSSRSGNTEIGAPATTGTNAETTPGPDTPVASRSQNTEIGGPTTVSSGLAGRITGAGAVQVVVVALGVGLAGAMA